MLRPIKNQQNQCVLTGKMAMEMDVGWDFVPDLEELKTAFKSGGVEECRGMLEKSETSGRTFH